MEAGPFARFDGHEQVVFGADEDTGLTCIVAIHSTQLGPSLGGTRFRAYASEHEALTDVLRLSRAMSYKAACAGLALGGGKAAIIGEPATTRSDALLEAYGRVIESLNGRYITACDIGTTPADIAVIRRQTRWATGAEVSEGGSGDSGVLTAHGVHLAMRVVAEVVFGDADLGRRHVAVQGVGKVGARLVEHLVADGAKVTVADTSAEAVARVAGLAGVEVVDSERILEVEADILSPNALGAVLSERTIPGLRVRAVCGGANNQLATAEDAVRLHERGILYAPDYVVNSGGIINVAEELHPDGHDPRRAGQRAAAIPDTLARVFAIAEELGTQPEVAATRLAEERMAAAGPRRLWLPSD